MQGETNADWRIGEYMKNNILIINEDEKEATELKNRLQSTTTNVFCCFTMQDALTCFVKHDFCLIRDLKTIEHAVDKVYEHICQIYGWESL